MEIVEPHKLKSRLVQNEKDYEVIMKLAPDMYKLLHQQIGLYDGGRAVAHCQITDKDPMRFFVTRDDEIIVNPVILKHTNTTIDSKEGCLSYADKSSIIVQRYNKMEVAYDLLNQSGLTKKQETINGKRAKIFQHEMDHFEAKYIYD